VPGHRRIVVWNHNRLLSRFAGADGVKTGFVRQSGHTLVASATRGGWQLLVVVLHPVDLWGDAARLLSHGFAYYRSVELARAGEEVGPVEVPGAEGAVVGVAGRSVFAVLARGEAVARTITILPHLTAPVRAGEPVGTVEFSTADRLVASAPLLAAKDVQAHSDLVRMIEWMAQFSGGAVQ
jgi:D-alanyl-D-alanine carboxypeptidase (penicillin-binding protein 5/6)